MSFSLFRIGKIWHYRFTVDGRRVQRSSGETLRKSAEPVAAQAYRLAMLWARNQRLVPTLRELVLHWLNATTSTVSAAHRKIVETFGRLHLYELADVEIDRLTTAMVENARNHHLVDHAPSSANQWLRVIKLLCNWAVRRQVIPAVPFTVRLQKVQKKPRALLPASLAGEWLHAIDRHQGERTGIRTAVRLMMGLGLRESETISARWEWIDWDRHTYTPGVTKGREADPLPIPEWLAVYLTPHRRSIGLIVAKPNGFPFAPGYTWLSMLAASRAVGAGHITAHRLRGTYATMLSEAGAPVQSVQRAMRHKSPMTTMGYLEANLHQLEDGQRKVAHRFGFDRAADLSGEEVAKGNYASPAQQGAHDYQQSS